MDTSIASEAKAKARRRWRLPDPFALIKARLPKGLYQRSLIIIVAPVVLLQLVIANTFYERYWQRVTEQLSSSIGAEIGYIIDTGQYALPETGTSRLEAVALERFGFTIAYQPGASLPQTGERNSLLEQTIASKFAETIRYPFWFDVVRREKHVDIRVAVDGGVVQVLVPSSRVYATNWHIFLVWVFASSLFLLAIAVGFLRNQVRPILRLAYAAEAFGKGRDIPSFKPSGAREVRIAAAAFLDMRDRMRRHIEQRTEMLAGVSHDLRTPLTRMKLELALMRETPEIAELRGDIREMERMLDEFLDFARGQGGEEPQLTDLVALAAEACDWARREGHDVHLAAEGELVQRVRRHAFKRCLANLLTNATRYGTHVEVTVARREGTIEIAVDDNGPGIPADQREEAFKPFRRLDPSRDPNKAGVGLGLSIARDIARGHGGDIVLSDSALGGLSAVIRLPA
jgi:two-component system, OmpR family, osmolarity sensor histidine kinase EnvZ